MAVFICGKDGRKNWGTTTAVLITDIEIPVSRLQSLPICTMVKNDP